MRTELESSSFWEFDFCCLWVTLMAVFGADRSWGARLFEHLRCTAGGKEQFYCLLWRQIMFKVITSLMDTVKHDEKTIWNDIFVLKNLGCMSSGKKNNSMMLTIISSGRLLVCQLLELNEIQRPYILAAEAYVFLNNLLHKILLRLVKIIVFPFSFFLHVIRDSYWNFIFF